MDRKIPFHVDLDAKMEKRKESMGGSSGSSSSLGGSSSGSDTSSIGKTNKGPRVCGVIAVAMVIVAVLVGVTIYLIDVEKQKQELAKTARIMEGKETEMDFAEEISDYQEKPAVKTEIGFNEGNHQSGTSDHTGSTEAHGGHQYEMKEPTKFQKMGGKNEQRNGGPRRERTDRPKLGRKVGPGPKHGRNGGPKHERLETGMPERANNRQRYSNLDQRQKMYQTFLKGKQEFFRPSEDVETPLSKILEAGRGLLIDSDAVSYTFDEIFSESTSSRPTTSTTQPRTLPPETFEPSVSSSDLEFGGVGLFGTPKEEENHRVEQEQGNNPPVNNEGDPPMTIQSMRRYRPGGSDIYDMSGYVKAPGPGQKGGDRKAFPRRNFRMRQRLLRQGMEGRLKAMAERFPGIGIDNLEERIQSLEGMEGRFPQNDLSKDPAVSFTDIEGPLEEGGIRPTIPLHGGRNTAAGIPLLQLAEQRLQMMERGGRPLGELAGRRPIGEVAGGRPLGELPGGRPMGELAGGLADQSPIHMAERGMETIDRRPGRPAFHHLGPGPNRRFSRRRMAQGVMRHRKGQGVGEGVRQGQGVNLEDQLAAESVDNFPLMDVKQEDMLNTFDMFIKLAGSEMGALKDVAKNITSSGEFNLWQILEAVNGTVRKNPNSNIAQLMDKFQDKYLSADRSLDGATPAQAIYERSLSSLLFLSMGIFLLNSVNELSDSGMLAGEGEPRSARMMPSNSALETLVTDPAKHHDVLQLFNTSTFDFFESPVTNVLDAIKPRDPANTVNNYVRLVMNLMNAYIKDSAEFECIYATYCAELNHQAGLGGMASNIAKINSVGLRLALREISSSATVPAVVRSLFSWSNLPCTDMFPQCGLADPPQRVDLEKR